MQDTIWANDGDTMVARIADLPWKENQYGRRSSDSATEDANARLIAAAPELLEVAKSLIALCPSKEGMGGNAPIGAFFIVADMARAAIARATGE